MKWMGRSSYEEDKSVQLNLEPRLVLKSKKRRICSEADFR